MTPPSQASPADQGSTRAAKHALRRSIRLRREARTAAARAADGQALVEVAMAAPEVARARVVAAYLGVGVEPPTLALLETLLASGTRVLLPVVGADRTLDWGLFAGAARLTAPGYLGLREPTGDRLGFDALAGADTVLVPAMAVDRRGFRLGSGGGYYDRALAGIDVPTLAVVYRDEVLDEVPIEAHDRPVTGGLTPGGRLHLSAD